MAGVKLAVKVLACLVAAETLFLVTIHTGFAGSLDAADAAAGNDHAPRLQKGMGRSVRTMPAAELHIEPDEGTGVQHDDTFTLAGAGHDVRTVATPKLDARTRPPQQQLPFVNDQAHAHDVNDQEHPSSMNEGVVDSNQSDMVEEEQDAPHGDEDNQLHSHPDMHNASLHGTLNDFAAEFRLPPSFLHLEKDTDSIPGHGSLARGADHPDHENMHADHNPEQAGADHVYREATGGATGIAAGDSPSAERNILIIGEMGKTGSNELLELLAAIPDSFALFEPFKNYKYLGKLPLPGSFSTLYSCSFLQDNAMASQVIWPGDSRKVLLGQLLGDFKHRGIYRPKLPATTLHLDNSSTPLAEESEHVTVHTVTYTDLLRNSESLQANFTDGDSLRQEDMVQISSKCKAAKVKITKTIRFTGYVRLIPEEVKKSIKVIHMLRHPEGLLQSLHLDKRAQNAVVLSEPVSCGGHEARSCKHCGSVSHFCNGVCKWNRETTTCERSFVHNHYEQVVDVCKRMAGGIAAVTKMRKDQVMFLRYEDLARSPVLVVKMIYGFLGIPFTDRQRKTVEAISKRQQFDKHIDPSEMLSDASNWPKEVVEACASLVTYGYLG